MVDKGISAMQVALIAERIETCLNIGFRCYPGGNTYHPFPLRGEEYVFLDRFWILLKTSIKFRGYKAFTANYNALLN